MTMSTQSDRSKELKKGSASLLGSISDPARWLISKNVCLFFSILFLFRMMLFSYKLSNLSLSVSFCSLFFRYVWVCLEMSKIQKTVHLLPKVISYKNLLDFIKYFTDSKHNYLQAKFQTLSYNKNLQITKQLFIYRIINKNGRQS